MIPYLIQTNFTSAALVLFLYIFLLTGTTLGKVHLRMFLAATVILNVLIISDAADYYISTFSEPHIMRYITSATGYSIRPAAIYLMILVAYRLGNKRSVLYAIPMFINALIAYTSVFTHLMFYFDETNKFCRGPLGFLPFLISGVYLVVLIVLSIKKYRIGNKLQAAVVILIALMIAMSVVMETVFHFKFIINGVGGASIIFYYVFLNTQTYKRDAMTNALNRHSFYVDIERMTKKSIKVVSLDLNNLKKINDTEGHVAGDTAIRAAAQTIFTHIPIWYSLYRMGGDEFTLLCPKASMKDVENIMNKISRDMTGKGYYLAWGCAQYEPGMSFEQVMALSDSRMYENKRMSKQEAAD